MNSTVMEPAVEAQRHELNLKSFFSGGFECSTHIKRSGNRLDIIASTYHDKFAMADYVRLQQQGIRVAREGVRWHLAEAARGHYDFSSVLPMARAARATGTQVIWDLFHFGWPDHLDVFKPEFVSRLADFAVALVKWLAEETDGPAFIAPINEPSFMSWAGGDEGSMFPFVTGRGFELKAQFVRAAIQSMDAIWAVRPDTRFVHVDPIVHVVASPRHPEEQADAEATRLSQYQAWDMLAGHIWPELGGGEKYMDIVGVNFYPHNQWFYNLKGMRRIRKFMPLNRKHPLYRPLRSMLAEVHERYRCPLIISETGAENEKRRGWLRYVCEEASAAIAAGVPLHNICLYPIVNHPGWTDSRHCHNALWDYPDEKGHRKMYAPLGAELRQWRTAFEEGEQENGAPVAPARKRARARV